MQDKKDSNTTITVKRVRELIREHFHAVTDNHCDKATLHCGAIYSRAARMSAPWSSASATNGIHNLSNEVAATKRKAIPASAYLHRECLASEAAISFRVFL